MVLSYGTTKYGTTKAEEKSLKYRRSLYISNDMREGEIFTNKNLRAIRPGYGLKTKYLEKLLGQKVSKDVTKGTPMNWNLVKK